MIILRKGKKPDKLSTKKFPGSVPYLDILAIEKGIINQYADSYSTLLATFGDLFIVADGSRSGLVGIGIEGAVGSTLLCITPIGVDNFYLYYFLKLKYEDLNGNTIGASIPHLNLKFFGNLKVPLAPIEEQKRIVVELQNQLTLFEKEFSNAEDEIDRLREFRQSVLNQAVLGDLSSLQDKSVKVISKPPKTWQVLKIEELAEFIGSGKTPYGGSSNYLKKGIPFLRSQNIYPNKLILNDVVYISEELNSQMERTQLKAKDVLLNITGASIGRSAYIPEGFGEGNVNQHVCIIRTNEKILPEYLSLFLNSPIGQDSINNLQKGVTRQGLNYEQIRSIAIYVPPKKEQAEIIKQVEAQDNKIQDLEKQYFDKINNSNQLYKAVLQMAFEGQLSTSKKSDSDVVEFIKNIDQRGKELIENMANLKIQQKEKSTSFKRKLDKKSLKTFIELNFTNKDFTAEELFTSLNIPNQFELFNDLLFSFLQEKLKDQDSEPFLEAIYDAKNKRQILKIKSV